MALTISDILCVITGVSMVLCVKTQTVTVTGDGIRCRNDTECPDGFCCVHTPLNRPETQKRFLFEEYEQYDHGYCRKERKFNESCYPLGHSANNPDLYEFFCPCEVGLECRGLIVHESEHQIIHEHPRCQDPESSILDNGNTPSGLVCNGDVDCPAGLCCVLHPLSRRQSPIGYCRNERKENETCNMVDVVPDMHDFQCPCEAGYECRASNVHHYNSTHIHENPTCQSIKDTP